MNSTDYAMYEKVFPGWVQPFNSICLLSPWPEQWGLMRRLFPNAAKQCALGHTHWDLYKPYTEGTFDLIVAMNVFSYSKDPDCWFRNVLAVCKEFWLQDHVCRKRSYEPGREFSSDGECMRYTYPPQAVTVFKEAYDLHSVPVMDFVSYNDPTVNNGFPAISFLARIKGKL